MNAKLPRAAIIEVDRGGEEMRRIVERPGALDAHQATVMACVRVWKDRIVAEHVAEFKTTVQVTGPRLSVHRA